MNTNKKKKNADLKQLVQPQQEQTENDIIRAKEFQLVDLSGNVRMCMKLDSKGYPKIEMGDFLSPKKGDKATTQKQILIGFTNTPENPDEVWPRIDIRILHEGKWYNNNVAVTFRKNRDISSVEKMQVYPELNMNALGKTRLQMALSPDENYKPFLNFITYIKQILAKGLEYL
jgi:hypothetical protein